MIQIGEFKLPSTKIVTAVIRIGESKKTYSFETMYEKQTVAKKEFKYFDYFT